MPNVLTITCDASKLDAQLSQAESRVKSAQSAMQSGGAGGSSGTAAATQEITNAGNAANTAGGQIAAAGNVVSAFGSAAGVSVPPLGQFRSAIKALANPIGLVTILIAGLVLLIIQKYKNAIQDQIDLAETNAKSAKETADAHKELRDKVNGYLDTLQQLASKESMSNAEKAKAIQTVRALAAAYGDLGIKVDSVTGRITGLDAAMAKKLKADKEQEIRDLENERNSLSDSNDAWKAYIDSFTTFSPEAINNASDKMVKNWARIAEIDRRLSELRRSDPVRDYFERRQAEIDDIADRNGKRENSDYDAFMRSSAAVKKTDRIDYLRSQFEDFGNRMRVLEGLISEEYDPEKHGSKLEFEFRRAQLHGQYLDTRAKFIGYGEALLGLLKPPPGFRGGVMTNSLTARGGFQSGRVNLEERSRSLGYIREIAANTSRYLDYQRELLDTLRWE